jgi:hypothetical protein
VKNNPNSSKEYILQIEITDVQESGSTARNATAK